MKITDVSVQNFRYISNTVRDSEGHGHPGDPHEATQSILTISTDEGVSGYSFGAPAGVIERLVKPLLVGQDPLYREHLWQLLRERQRLNLSSLSDRVLSAVDLALWDLVGRYLGQPVHKILGATRDKVPAYASTMCGDDLKGGLSTPQEYADFATWAIKERGYPAFKLHTWQPPMPGAPSVKRDIEACAAVREAVGPDVDLMLDPFHYYSREESLQLARGLEKLDYLWMEEPMGEHSMSSFVWLTEQADLLIVGPETAEGKHYACAEWISAAPPT
ncbi:MAG: enolase C-terminal domain-like protein [Caldilineaceae bacterium]